MPETFTFEDAAAESPATFGWDDAVGVAPRPSLLTRFSQAAAEAYLAPTAADLGELPESHMAIQLPRVHVAPEPTDVEPAPRLFGIPSPITSSMTRGGSRQLGAIAANAALSGAEGLIHPSTPAIVAAATVAPEVVIPTLTATMAKSGSTELAEGLEAMRAGRTDEGVEKLGSAATALGFAAAPALHPQPFAAAPKPGVVGSVGEMLGRRYAAATAPRNVTPRAKALTTEPPPAPAMPATPAESREMARVRAMPEGPEGEAQLVAEDIAKAVADIDVSDLSGSSPVPALVRLIRRAARDPAMKTAAEQAMQKVGEAARAQGVSLDTIKTQLAGELQAVYGADAPEMARYYFGEPPKAAAPDAIRELRMEGVTQADAEALLAGDKTIKEVVEGNFKVTPAWTIAPDAQGHAEAWMEGYNQAIERLTGILERAGVKPPAPTPLPAEEQAAAPEVPAARAEEAPAAQPAEPAPAEAPAPTAPAAPTPPAAAQAKAQTEPEALPPIERKSPATGTAERDAIESAFNAASAKRDAAYEKIATVKAERDKLGRFTQARERKEKQLERLEEAYRKVKATTEDDINRGIQAHREDRAVAVNPLAAIDAREQLGLINSTDAYNLKKRLAKEEAVRQGATPQEADAIAIDAVTFTAFKPDEPLSKLIEWRTSRTRFDAFKRQSERDMNAVLAEAGLRHGRGTPTVTEARLGRAMEAANDRPAVERVLQEARDVAAAAKAETKAKEATTAKREAETVAQELALARRLSAEGKLYWARAVRAGKQSWIPVEAKSVKLAGFPWLKTFIRKSPDGKWNVTEETTGLSMGEGKTRPEAIKAATDRSTQFGEAELRQRIATAASGLPPKPSLTEPSPSTLQADIAAYAALRDRFKALSAKGDIDSPEFQAVFKQIEDLKNKHGGMPPGSPPPAGAASPSEPATGPSLTLLGLSEDKFSLPSLRKLSRDTIRRLANSLGTDATVPAVARRAAERFTEMRAQPPGPVGMGGALSSEMSGMETPKAGTPAHAVETGPPAERPLGLTDPTSSPFVSLSLEMLGQPSSVPPEYSVDTGLKSLAGASAPRLTAMSRPAGEALVRYASSKIAAPYKALVFASRVLDTGVNAIKFGAALVEDNLRSIEQEFLRQSNEAFEKGDQATADDFYERALNVRSIVGGKNSPFKTEQEYQDFLHDPVTQEAVKRHVQYWQEDIEPQFKMAQGIDPTVELPTRGQQTGARINLKAVLEGEERGTRPVTASRGGLTSSFKRKSPFAREAKGTGDIYESNYPDIIANTYNRQLEIANQNHMNALLVDKGLARINKPGARVLFDDKPGVPFPLTRRLILTDGKAIPAGQNIYVRPEFAPEYRRALNVDAPARIPFFTEFSNLFTKAALWGLTDASVHLSNLGTALFTRPHSPILWDALAKVTGRADVPITIVRTLIKAAADNREQLAQLAEIGAMRESFTGTGLLNPLIKWADRNTRLVLDDAYSGLAKQGLVENSETARREFINQVGQYNKRLQGQFTVWLRDTGVGPFATAGKTFNALGLRNMLLSPGLKAASPKAAVALRANALAGWVGFVTLAATINYLASRSKGGGVMGRPGIPIGNVDLGTEDERGRPLSLPLGDLLGYTRGLRSTGARRLLEARRSGIDTNQAIDSALGDVVNASVSPALGPLVRTSFAAATGRPPALNVGRSAPVVGPDQSQFAANVLDALRKANPVVNTAFDLREGKPLLESARGQAPRFTPQAGMTESRAEATPHIIERARLNDFMDDLARRARRLPRGDRLSFIRDEINKAELTGAERITAFRKVRSTLKFE